MMEITYDRDKAVKYANEWALKRNRKFFDFELFGGDCSNFVSQSIFAGAGMMNYTKTFGWYYISSYDRSPSWTGVQYLYDFLTKNKSDGPYAVETDISNLEIGDIVQLGDSDMKFYHSLFITKIDGVPSIDTIYVSTHSIDVKDQKLSSYVFENVRGIKILGVRKFKKG